VYTVCAVTGHNLLDKGGGEIVFLYASLAVAGRSGERDNIQGFYLLSQEQRRSVRYFVACLLSSISFLPTIHILEFLAVPGWCSQLRNCPALFSVFIKSRGIFCLINKVESCLHE